MKPTLPTNYKDDILNTSVEGMRRYQMIYNSDNTVSFKDVTPYDQTGSDFGAGDINLTNQAVNESADAGKIIDDPDTAGATTQNGYIAGVQLFNHVNDSLGNIYNIGNDTYNSLEKLLQYYIDNGYLPDVKMILLSGTVFASSTYAEMYSPDNAFNYDSSGEWLPTTGSGKTDYIGLALEKQYTIKKATIEISGGGQNISPYVVLQGSNNNSTWDDISSSIALVSTKSSYEIVATDETPYQYVRLYFNPTICVDGGSTKCMPVKYVKFYGV